MNPATASLRTLVTGGAGFIGSHLVEALVATGDRVTVLDDFNDYYDPARKERNLAAVRDRIALVRGDLRDEALVESTFASGRFDRVFHLAARAGVRPSIADPRLYLTTNIDGTFHLLEACRRHGVRRFVFASSSSVYGLNRKVPFAEEDLIAATISPYATTKLAGEQLCANYAHLHGIRCACLRFFTVYGPRQRPDLAIAKFTARMLRDEPIEQYGDGSTARDYTYIDDILAGILAAARYDESTFEIFNLGGSATHTLAELIAALEAALGRTAKIHRLPEQPGDVPRTWADIGKARRLLGWSPKTPLAEGLRLYAAWVRNEADGALP